MAAEVRVQAEVEEEENFGPQPLCRLEVCTVLETQILHLCCHEFVTNYNKLLKTRVVSMRQHGEMLHLLCFTYLPVM